MHKAILMMRFCVWQGKTEVLGFKTGWTKFQDFRTAHERRDFTVCGAAAVRLNFQTVRVYMYTCIHERIPFLNIQTFRQLRYTCRHKR
jgi:hypothetical protein